MPTDYDRIREDNIREYGQGTRHLSYFADIYTTRTHFLYEILQNAEDALARRTENSPAGYVHFHLHNDRLEVRHNGAPFTNCDVSGICGIGEGTKADDFTQIGKFGIGFKSVYAYTFYPQIHSGDEHFEICRFVEPHAADSLSETDTLIVLPFDQPDKRPSWAFREDVPAETSVQEIGDAIQQLGIRTMLFLHHIEEIKWTIPDGNCGHFIRSVRPISGHNDARKVEIRDHKGELEEWQIFQKTCEVRDAGKSHDITVEVAYLLKDGAVARASDTELVVYFPTEKKTELGFLLQAPFKTTKSRDNIKSDSANHQMIKSLAELAASSLEKLRDLGLLNVISYKALPLRINNFPIGSLFRPIYDEVRKTLQSQPLLPAHDDSFVCACEASLARGKELVELFSSEQLVLLFGREKLTWLDSSITESGTNADLYSYLAGRKNHSCAKEWEQEPLTENIQIEAKDIAGKLTVDFFKSQDERWLIRFYIYLTDNYNTFKNTPFIRLEDGRHIIFALDKPNAYLPPVNISDIDRSIFPLINQSLINDVKIREFFSKIVGLREPDKIDVVCHWLPKKFGVADFGMFDEDWYVRDLKEIAEAYHSVKPNDPPSTRLINQLKQTPFIAAVPASNPQRTVFWKKPGDSALYRRSQELELWFAGNELDKTWFPLRVAVDHLPDDLKSKLGLAQGALIKRRSSDGWDSQKRCYHRTKGGFDFDADIVGIGWAVNHPTMGKAVFLWGKLLENVSLIKGTELQSPNKQFPADRTKEVQGYSKLGEHCRNNAWLPKQGTPGYFLPSDLLLSKLPDDFEKDTPRAESLSRALGMKQPISPETIEALGFNSDEELQRARDIVQSPDDLREFEEFKRSKQQEAIQNDNKERPTFPNRSVANPERRQESLGEQLTDARDKEYEKRERSVQVPTEITDEVIKTWLRYQYMNDDDQMVCQICKMEHFRKRNGEHHFEKKEVFTSKFLPKKLVAQYLALCPLCAAKYDEFVKTDDEVMAELRKEIVSAEDCEIPISLGDKKTSIRFVETHHHDLKVIIEGAE